MWSISEGLIVLAAFLILYGYQFLHYLQVRHNPMSTSVGFNNHARAVWVKHIQKSKLDILAIQTLRNWTMAATFLASTAILMALGILSFALTSDGLNELAHDFNLLGSQHHTLLIAKALLLALTFLFSFMSFALAVRSYNHASFLINIPPNYHLSINSENVITTINQAALYYNLGMRGYYTSVPLVLWLLGPTWMLAAAAVITFVNYKLDHGI